MKQFPLTLPLAEDYSPQSFFPAAANEEALGLVNRWPDWGSAYGLLIYGEEGCGKTHLAHLWQARAQAMFLAAGEMIDKSYLNTPRAHFIIDGLGDIKDKQEEEAFFHFLNHVQQSKGYVLCTSRAAPVDLQIRIPDVRSRIMGFLQVRVAGPDEALLASLMLKRLADRQLKVAPEVVQYAVNRIERSYRAVNDLVQKLDAHALENRREITIPLVREILP